MARTTMAMVMAMKAVLLVALLSLFPCASLAGVEESMPALLAHIREIQRLAKAAHGESVEVDQPVQLDSLSSSLGVTDAAESDQSEQSEPEPDPTSQLFAHIHAVQRKAQEAAEEWEKLNGEEKEQLVEDVKEEENEADPATDALVQSRFDQLDAALKFLNNKDNAENTDGDDDVISFSYQLVLETDQSHKHDEVSDVESEDQTDVASQLFAHIHAVKRKAQEAEKLNGEVKEEVVELVEEESDPATDALVQARFNQLNAALKFLNNRDDAESTQWSADADDDAINLLHQFVQLETDQSQKHDEIASSEPVAAPVESEPEADATSQLFAHIHAVQRKAAEELEKLNGEEKEELVELVKEEADPATDALVQARFNQLNAALKFLNYKDDAESTQWSADADDDAINLLHQFVQNRHLGADQSHKHDEIGHDHANNHAGSDAQHHDHDHSGHSHGESFKSNKIILPEEIAEEEDLLQHSFDGENHASVDHLFRSSAPNLANGKPSEKVVNALASFGAGAMLGDAFLHQIPHAYGNSESPHLQEAHQPHHDHIHSHAHDHISSAGHAHSLQDLSIGLAVLGGILVFFIVEKVVRRYEELSSEGGQRTLGHSHHHQKRKKKAKQLESPTAAVEVPVTFENKEPNSLETKSSDTKKRKNSKKKVTASGRSQISAAPGGFVTGYLSLFSDAVHNFTDGMALGSAFLLHGTMAGWSRTLFLLAHELPQEVGDFGILVKSGFSVFEALAFNFLSALVALAGTAAALMLGGSSGHSSLIEGFIAGGFIYMSVGGVMPSMHDRGSSLSSTLSQLVPLVLGMGVAIVISLAE